MMQAVLSNSGQVVTPERALRCAAVLACIRILCEDLSRDAVEPLPANVNRGRVTQRIIRYSTCSTTHLTIGRQARKMREAMILDVLCFGQIVPLKRNSTGTASARCIHSVRDEWSSSIHWTNFIPPPVPFFTIRRTPSRPAHFDGG